MCIFALLCWCLVLIDFLKLAVLCTLGYIKLKPIVLNFCFIFVIIYQLWS